MSLSHADNGAHFLGKSAVPNSTSQPNERTPMPTRQHGGSNP